MTHAGSLREKLEEITMVTSRLPCRTACFFQMLGPEVRCGTYCRVVEDLRLQPVQN